MLARRRRNRIRWQLNVRRLGAATVIVFVVVLIATELCIAMINVFAPTPTAATAQSLARHAQENAARVCKLDLYIQK
jgi:hypothetical protein